MFRPRPAALEGSSARRAALTIAESGAVRQGRHHAATAPLLPPSRATGTAGAHPTAAGAPITRTRTASATTAAGSSASRLSATEATATPTLTTRGA
eukprot:scaffold484080_cov47-Prasinocladus_malaysianus.AAC.1